MTEKQKEFSDKIKAELEQLASLDDQETAHVNADNLLCQLLEHLGFKEVVEAYEKIDKWYT
jgi:hypothetical protein